MANTVEALWDDFAASCVAPEAPESLVDDMRQCFIAGFSSGVLNVFAALAKAGLRDAEMASALQGLHSALSVQTLAALQRTNPARVLQ